MFHFPVTRWVAFLITGLIAAALLQAGAYAKPHHGKHRDSDGDGLSNWTEVHRTGTNPRKADTDGEGLSDWTEVRRTNTNPRKADTDGDGLTDWTEVRRTKTNPRRADSDGDGYSDLEELLAGTDPWDPMSHPGGQDARVPLSQLSPPATSPSDETPPPDTSAPDTAITAGPSGTTTTTSATFSFTASEGGSSFECKLDSGSFAACSSPKAYSALRTGGHTFSVRAADDAGNVDPSPATRSWTIVSEPSQPDDVEAVWSAPANARANVPVELNGTGSTGNGALSCTWSFENETGSNVFDTEEGCAIDFTFESTGTKYVRLSVSDTSGGSDSNKQAFVVGAPPDTIPPDTSISSGPSGTTSSTAASFSFTSTESGLSFECKLDSGAYGACTSPKAYSGLGEGAHSFSVRAIDAASNVDPTPATQSWTVDTSTPPDTTPPDTSISSGPSGTTSSTAASFSFTSTESGSSFECKLDSGAYAACASPKAYSGLGEGAHSFSVRAIDAASNVDPTPATRSWTVEASSPPPSGSNCFSVPSSCGYPDPTNTGIPPGTTLTSSGAITASTAGQVIVGKDVSGGINVKANNVTIENSRVANEGDCGPTNTCGNWSIRIEAGVTGTVIRNVETVPAPGTTCEHDIRNTSSGTVEIVGSYLHACDSNIYSVGNTTLRNSYSIAKIAISTDHVENVYFSDSTFTAIHSTMLSPVEQTAVIFGNVNGGSGGTCSNHLTVEESLLAGGGYTLYPCGNGTSAGSSTWVVKNNHFARCRTSEKEVSGGHWVCQNGFDQYGYYPGGGSYGLDAYSFSSGRTWSGNVWDDNLASIPAP